MAKIIDGKKISAEIKEELKTEVAAYAAPVPHMLQLLSLILL